MQGGGEPLVLRGLVNNWPAVAAGRAGSAALLEYLRRLDSGAPVDAIMTPPDVEGRIFYREALNGFNFVRNRLPLTAVAQQALRVLLKQVSGENALHGSVRLPLPCRWVRTNITV